MGRVVTYMDQLDAAVDEGRGPLLEQLGGEIATDASGFAHERTGTLKAGIHALDPEGDTVVIQAHAEHADEAGPGSEYDYYAEVGTSDTPAQRFLERALYRQRG